MNRSLVMDVFSFVDILFIGECPRDGDEGFIAHDNMGFELFSFVQGSGVEVFCKPDICGLFQVVEHRVWGCIISWVYKAVTRKLAGCYVHPKTTKEEWLDVGRFLEDTDAAMGDFNCRHDRWASPGEIVKGRRYRGNWLCDIVDAHRWEICVPGRPTFDNISTIDLFIGLKDLTSKVNYTGKAELQHDAIISRVFVSPREDMIPPRPNWGKIDKDVLVDAIKRIADHDDQNLWEATRSEVEKLPRVRRKGCAISFWNDDLERMRSDVRIARRRRYGRGDGECYRLIRRVYRAMILQARRDFIAAKISKAGDSEIFRINRNMTAKRTLPIMIDGDRMASTHEDISDLIAKQLKPGEKGEWTPEYIDMGHCDELALAIRRSPKNTGPGMDDMGYPFVRFWARTDMSSLSRLIQHGLNNDIEDWHKAHTVLIEKADKPRYDIVKSWRMIYLLPVMAKITERIILLRLAQCVELEETQFGSRRRRGVHDAMAVVFEFIRHHEGWKTAMVSMDIEGGFDNIQTDLLIQFLQSRGADIDLCRWIRRWAGSRSIQFKFNGRLSKEYHTTLGIPQGSPLSPYLFAVYVADILKPRLRYTPTVRHVVTSYVDDGVILVATNNQEYTKDIIRGLFDDCDRIGRERGMGFSLIKTKWIGFGDRPWSDMGINGVMLAPVSELRVLGYYFNIANNFHSHVQYWLRRGLDVRKRISALGRRFGGCGGGIDAFGIFRLIQSVYLPTVYYGLEWITDYKSYVKSIQTHVNDCLRSLYRAPLKTPNNALLAELAVQPGHIRGRYLQRRCYARMINYQYCHMHEWYGSIRTDWAYSNIVPLSITSDKILDSDFVVNIWNDKEQTLARHEALIDDISLTDENIIYTDGSKKSSGCAAAYVIYERGLTEGEVGIAVPSHWSIVDTELFAIYEGLRRLRQDYTGAVWVFSDCVPALRAIDNMRPDGVSAGLWDAMVPVINSFDKLWFEWVPAHRAVGGNERADRCAQQSVTGPLHPHLWEGLTFGTAQDSKARELLTKEWRDWHIAEGHCQYNKLPSKAKHMRGLSRLDKYILMRLRIGRDLGRCDECPDSDERLHLSKCSRYSSGRPRLDTLFSDKHIHEWRTWWQSHMNFGLGIPREHVDLDNTTTVCGNPFNYTVTIMENGSLKLIDLARNRVNRGTCDWCMRTSTCDGTGCYFPTDHMAGTWYWIPRTQDCPFCKRPIQVKNISSHFKRYPSCRTGTFQMFWSSVVNEWDTMDRTRQRSAVLIWRLKEQDGLQCHCGVTFKTQYTLGQHLKQKVGWRCYLACSEAALRWAQAIVVEG